MKIDHELHNNRFSQIMQQFSSSSSTQVLDEEELSSQSQPNQMGECNDIFVSNDQCDMFAHVEKELEEGEAKEVNELKSDDESIRSILGCWRVMEDPLLSEERDKSEVKSKDESGENEKMFVKESAQESVEEES